MLTKLVPAVFVVVAALVVAAVATPLAGRVGSRLGIVDRPGGRRRHAGAIARIGGVGLFAAFFGSTAVLFAMRVYNPEHALPLAGVLLGSILVFAFGLADDRYEYSAWPQILVQLAAAAIAIATTVFIQQVTLPFVGPVEFPWFITIPLTTLWVMGMMNTVNFLDGLDGLAAGVGAIAALLFAVHSYRLGQDEIALYSLALVGACLGFLYYNFHPARVFLGSAGAMTLGYALATLSILAPARVATALLVMAVPIADTAFQIYDRWRRGQPPMRGDRGHLHYRLIDLGLSQRQIVVGYWVFCAVFGTLALVIDAPVYKLIAMGALGLVVVGLLATLRRRGPRM
jgi:UDP-GlcNAc:undecaprenyl-phosphate/decaprenyl-phosphate GlcNAc-1-phosphate transferase